MRGNTAPYAAVGGYPLPLGFNGRLAWIYRWLSGRPMNGHRYTDATGFRYGTMALDVSGHATPYQLLPGALRFLYVRLPIMMAIPIMMATYVWPEVAYLVANALVLVATWRVRAWRRVHSFRRDVSEPVAAAVHAVLRTKRVAGQGHLMVSIPPNFRDDPDSMINIRLPLDWLASEGDKAALVKIVAERLKLEELTPAWSLHGSQPSVSLSQPQQPPTMISLLDAIADAEATEDGKLMVGYGVRRRPVYMSLLLESPHMIINGGSGAGKSEFLAFLVGQLMRRGYGVVVLDAKFVSHLWLKRIPGVIYASEAEDMHEVLCWLREELLRRARLVSTASDPEAASASLVPLVVVLEEMTTARGELDKHWKSIREAGEPALSPALSALAGLANMGREMKVHVLMAGQSITAKVTGGPEGRESYGGRAMARATANAWKMLAPQIKPAPVKADKPGRWHLVVADSLKKFQVPFANLKDRESVAALTAWATGGAEVPDVAAMMAGWGGGGGSVEMPSSEPPTPVIGISLRTYAEESGLELSRLIKWREKRSDFPSWVGIGARNTQLFDRDHLRAYVRERLREPVEAPAE
jgi:hypothetical protein